MQLSFTKKICALFLLSFLASTSVLHGQQIADTIKQEGGIFEKVTDLFTYEHPKFSISTYPVINYGADIGLGLGFTPIVRILPDTSKSIGDFYRPTTLVPYLMISTKGAITFEADFIVFTRNRWTYITQMRFADFPNVYYGIGEPTSDTVPYEFTSNDKLLIGELAKGIGNLFFAGVRYDFHKFSNANVDEDMLNKEILGIEGGWNTGLGPVLKFDNRNDIIYPTKGWFITGFALFNTEALGGNYKYNAYALDIRRFISLPGRDNMIGFQYNNWISTGDVPFHKMPKLGGSKTLRGIAHPNKYIDKNRWFVQAEYRKHLFWRIGATAFVGAGSVYNNESNYFTNTQGVAGLGFRFRIVPDDRLNFRVDYGMSFNGDKALYMTIREAF